MPDDNTNSSETPSKPSNDTGWPPAPQVENADIAQNDTQTAAGTKPTNEPQTAEPVTETPPAVASADVTETQPIAPVSAQSEPMTQTQPVVAESVKSSPGTLVLQWLTYAFWGWTILALAWLTTISISFFVNRDMASSTDNSGVAYSLAAVIVLFVISLICDFFYSKREPVHKHGAATVIMIIHAVIFALFGIGSLIVAVFAVVRMLIGDSNPYDSGDDGSVTMLSTGLIIAVVYGATLLRTLRPFKLKRSAPLYWLFMAVITITVTALGIIGPTAFASETRNDRLIEASLNEVSESVRNYTEDNGKLPASLADATETMSPNAKDLVSRNLVEYSPGEQIAQTNRNDSALPGTNVKPIATSNHPVYKYKLCVTYKAKRGSGSVRPSMDDVDPSTYSHAAGRVCYNLVTDYSYNYDKTLY